MVKAVIESSLVKRIVVHVLFHIFRPTLLTKPHKGEISYLKCLMLSSTYNCTILYLHVLVEDDMIQRVNCLRVSSLQLVRPAVVLNLPLCSDFMSCKHHAVFQA